LKVRLSTTKDLTNELTKLVTSGLIKHRRIKSKAAAKYSKERALKIWVKVISKFQATNYNGGKKITSVCKILHVQ
jgi:uncharacterized protein YjgD (DUF1641 family)